MFVFARKTTLAIYAKQVSTLLGINLIHTYLKLWIRVNETQL